MSEIRWKQRFENFKKANSNLVETADCIKQNSLNKIYTMALIQAFEMSFELAWKTMKDYLENDGILTDSPRTTIKEAFSSIANLAIIPMQDILGIDNSGRMNMPSTSGSNWTWRMDKNALKDSDAEKLFLLSKLYGRNINDSDEQ